MARPVLNIIGAGKLGSTLGRLLRETNRVEIGSLYSRDLEKARRAANFIGAGQYTDHLEDLLPADLWMLSLSDDAIAPVAELLSNRQGNWLGKTVFHCSGFHSSAILEPLSASGAEVASLHPAHSFAHPQSSLQSFAGSYCAVEGSENARKRLSELFSPLGVTIAGVNPDKKPIYHAGMAVASNHLVALLDSSVNMLKTAGLSEKTAKNFIEPLVKNTCMNFFNDDTIGALTGPVARGDDSTIENHLISIKRNCPELLGTYISLANVALTIARSNDEKAGHHRIAELLQQYATLYLA